MSEPQHPHAEGIQEGVAQSGAVAAGTNATPRGAQAAEPTSFDSLTTAAARLAKLRESRGWVIDDVSGRLKVPASKMRALEAGDISLFPGTTFALGVVRSYAKMLGVDPTPFTQALRREKGEPEPDLSMPAATGVGLPRGRVSVSLGGTQRHRSWWWALGAVPVALIALAMWHHGSEPPAWLARLRASANGAAANATGPTIMPIAGQTVASGSAVVADNAASAADQAANEAANEAPSMTADGNGPRALSESAASSGAVDVVVSQRPSAVSPATVVATPAPEASAADTSAKTAAAAVAQASSVAEPAKTIASTTPDTLVASATSAASAASAGRDIPGTSTVTFEVKEDSWISVRDKSGKQTFAGIVRAGEMKEVAGEEPFKVVAGNRLGIESITVDGKAVDAAKYAAGDGNVSRFSLP